MATIESILIADKFEEMRLKFVSGQFTKAKTLAEELLSKADRLSDYEKQKAQWHKLHCERELQPNHQGQDL